MRHDQLALIASLALLVPLGNARAAQPAAAEVSFLIVAPGGPGSQSQAQSFLVELAAALAASWPAGSQAPGFRGHYHVTEADAAASMKAHPPVFILASPGFYLARREQLEVLLQPQRAKDGPGTFHLVTAKPAAAATIAGGSIGGLRIGGVPVAEGAWTLRVVLPTLRDGGTAKLVPSARTLEAVRRLQSGALDAVLLHDADWRRLADTGKSGGLAVAFTSAKLPEGPVVTPRASATPELRRLATDAALALRGFGGTEAGRAVLRRMTLEGFIPATDADYDGVARLHQAGATQP